MATALTIDYSVGDTVYVAYPFPSSLSLSPITRVVSEIKVSASGDVASVKFEDGAQVTDSDATQTVFTTQTAAATSIINYFITNLDATVVLEAGATNSVASTASQPGLSLGRIDS